MSSFWNWELDLELLYIGLTQKNQWDAGKEFRKIRGKQNSQSLENSLYQPKDHLKNHVCPVGKKIG